MPKMEDPTQYSLKRMMACSLEDEDEMSKYIPSIAHQSLHPYCILHRELNTIHSEIAKNDASKTNLAIV